MSGDIVSLRLLAVFAAEQDRDQLRQAAGLAATPVDMQDTDSISAARRLFEAREFDVVLLDSGLPAAERADFLPLARAARPSPMVIVTAPRNADPADLAMAAGDGVMTKPAKPDEARTLIERCIRFKLPSRVLVVDDSATMRAIVRKILTSSRFPLDIFEAQEGIEALKQIGTGKFDFVFLDYNMPGLNGVETLSEIKRQYPRLGVVMMTSAPEEEVAERARAAGAAAFLKKPFFPTDMEAVLNVLYGLRVPRRPA